MDTFAVRDLTFFYPEQRHSALDAVSFTVRQGSFTVLAGPSGCGKSTLLRQLKSTLAPHGDMSGEVFFEGRPLAGIGRREQSEKIGFVQQSPENQIVTDKVWHELAFGLESLGLDTPVIRARTAEMAAFFGMESWFYKDVSLLSGGQKQLLNLASIMAMQPGALILDEPTSRLDPIAAADFIAAVGRVNRELGTTVIITEHRLDEVLPVADTLMVMDGGRIIAGGSPREVAEELRGAGHEMFLSMPAPVRIWAAVPNGLECPLSVRDGRTWLGEYAAGKQLDGTRICTERPVSGGETALRLEDVWFRYEKDGPDIVCGLTLSVKKGEILALLGGNGAGKTTALRLIAGLNSPYRGEAELGGSVGMLMQDPQAMFVKKTLREDLRYVLEGKGIAEDEKKSRMAYTVKLCRIEELLGRHPYDLSGGEQQRAALAKVLMLRPRILLLDEPTKGLDAEFKRTFAAIIRTLARNGAAVVMVSHDVEFCAQYADSCALLFNGEIVSESDRRSFFSGNSFYTTQANRMARELLPQAVTAEDVIRACGGDVPAEPEVPPYDGVTADDTAPIAEAEEAKKKLPLWRRLAAVVSAIAALAGMIYAINAPAGSIHAYAAVFAALAVTALVSSQRSDRPIEREQVHRDKRRLSKRTISAAAMILIAIPLTIYIGVYFLGDRKYSFISLLVLLETMLPFFIVFEGRKPQARELVTIAVLCAAGVAGRAAFFMLPEFKPVVAIVIISGVAMGGETGFLVGAMTMLASNVMFGQGPWTPWQMFAMGMIGFLAGVLFRKGLLRRGRVPLCVFGALASTVIYGGIMNPASVVMWQSNINLNMLLAAYAAGIPMDLVRAAGTVVFLWLISQPMLEKLDRIKTKYGLVE